MSLVQMARTNASPAAPSLAHSQNTVRGPENTLHTALRGTVLHSLHPTRRMTSLVGILPAGGPIRGVSVASRWRMQDSLSDRQPRFPSQS